MTPDDAIRLLAHEAKLCRDRDAHEALCLLLPALTKILYLEPMDDFEAYAAKLAIRHQLEHPEEVLLP